jgi:hypothetical protein
MDKNIILKKKHYQTLRVIEAGARLGRCHSYKNHILAHTPQRKKRNCTAHNQSQKQRERTFKRRELKSTSILFPHR